MNDTITLPPPPELPAFPAQTPMPETGPAAPGPSAAEAAVPAAAPRTAQQAPGRSPRVKAVHGVPDLLRYPYVREEAHDGTAAVDSPVADTAAADTAVTPEGEEMMGIVLVNPAAAYRETAPSVPAATPWSGGMSWIYLGLALLFCTVGLKFKGSKRYLKALVTDLTDTRVRHNAFDETVKETSLLVLLNVLWVASAGILLWVCVGLTAHFTAADSSRIMPPPARGIALCMGASAIYLALMMIAYWVVGSVFSDRKLTRLWLKGAAASTGLQTFLLFPLALLALNYPRWDMPVLLIAAGVFVIGKIVFLYKGFRIFFTQISSWLLFLYYLCSLEIVPLILTYLGAVTVCTTAF